MKFISISKYHVEGSINIEGLYHKKINPINFNLVIEKIKFVQSELPKFLSGSIVSINELTHLFPSRDEARKFAYICCVVFDKYTGKHFFDYEIIGDTFYIKSINNLNAYGL